MRSSAASSGSSDAEAASLRTRGRFRHTVHKALNLASWV
jgi:hypothetical protein